MGRIDGLTAFVRLVELGSFTRVAEELKVKQSTVSKWMAALESEVGTALIYRSTRALSVTDAGRRFYRHAQSITAAYQEAVSELRDERHMGGRLRLSLPVVFGRLHVVPLIADFLKEFPEVEVEMVMGDRYVALVEEGFDARFEWASRLIRH